MADEGKGEVKAAALELEAGTKDVEKKRLQDTPLNVRLWEIIKVLLPAGCYAFGGPSAHIAIFQDLFIKKLQWLNEKEFVDLLALGMTLPGPTSTEFAVAVGAYRGGLLGGLVGFLAWSLPSLAVMILAGLGISKMDPNHTPDWMSGLAPAAVVLIFIAFYRLAKKLVDSRVKSIITFISAAVTILVQDDPRINPRTILWLLPVLLVGGGLVTLGQKAYEEKWWRRGEVEGSRAAPSGAMGNAEVQADTYDSVDIPLWFSVAAVAAIAAFLFYLLGMSASGQQLDPMMKLFSSFFIVGITIYGGGQVILPVLVGVCVKPGWLSMDQFLSGFALVQMLPGPLFNMAAYIGAIYMGFSGALAAWGGLMLPGFLLVLALLPLWERVRKIPNVKPVLAGLNCAGLGLILAVGVSLYLKVVKTAASAVVSLLAAGLVAYWDYSSLIGVLAGGVLGFLLSPTCLNLGQYAFRVGK